MLRHLLRDNRGSAFVELALVLPLLTFVIIGAAELGRIAYYSIELSSAARAGASYGAENSANVEQITPIETVAQNDASDVTLTWTTAPTEACVCETVYTSGATPTYNATAPGDCTAAAITGCDVSNSTSTQYPIEYVDVTTTATVKTMFKYPGIPASFNLSGFAEMRVLQN